MVLERTETFDTQLTCNNRY